MSEATLTDPAFNDEAAHLPADSPFSQPWSLDLGLPDFAAVMPEHVEPAVRAGMARQRAEWEAVATNPEPPTVENTVAAVEASGDLLERALTVLGALTSATHSPELDALEEAMAPDLAAHSDAFALDRRLYERYKALDACVAAAGGEEEPRDHSGAVIDSATARLIRLTVEEFERGGVALEGVEAERLKEINARLTALGSRVSTLMAQAMHEAGVANFTATPELASEADPAVREELLARSMGRGLAGETDVRGLIEEEAALRAERAQLLGYANHSEIVAAESAARTSGAVLERLTSMVAPAMANVRADAQRYAARMAADPQAAGYSFGPAHWAYYEEAERRERFGTDDATLAPYLELNNVVTRGVFYAAHALYGLSFTEREDLAAHMYDADMRVWEVHEEDGSLLGLFVGDYYAREGKSGGAWMNSLVEQSHLMGTKPVIINCLNLTKPDNGPTLLTWDNVITAFHEFGHALHGLFADSTWPSASGTNVPRDVVEFPSQFNECWALHPQVLANYAIHVDTGEPMPAALAEQLRNQGSFGQGYATAEYLGAALLDQAWHTLAPGEVPSDPEQVETFEHEALAGYGLDESLVPPRYRSAYFQHIFAGGYSAAYYAYIWSEVMDADAVAWFRADGLGAKNGDGGLNREAGEKFRRSFLALGDSRDAAESYRAFAGRDPQIEHLLRRRALLD